MFNRNKPGDLGPGESPRDSLPNDGGVNPLSKPQLRPTPLEGADKGLHAPGMAPVKPRAAEVASRVVESRKPADLGPLPVETKKLIVGRGISLKGKIAACDRLIVEGKVEAELQDCHTIEITESGTVKGAAEIENAEVSGHYEGSLTVRKNLLIHGTGHVSGTIRYGRLQIEQGGEINGDVKSLGSSAGESRSGDRLARAAGGTELPLASSNA